MKFPQIFQALALALAWSPLEQDHFSPKRLAALANETKAMFFHGWNAYVHNALPFDELLPLSCSGTGPDGDFANIGHNDAMGNFSMTVLDSLDMLAILDEQEQFAYWVHWVGENVNFDQPTVVQVFETTIRAVGGLLSAHFYASASQLDHKLANYDGHLLKQAHDLASRLLPAFDTESGIPAPRVHLQHGIVPLAGLGVVTETCSAGAGSMLVEFTVLSELTGDYRFAEAAKRAFMGVWSRRSALDLVGLSIDSESGVWTDKFSSIGASGDSFYEYALKFSLLYPSGSSTQIWRAVYKAVEITMGKGWFYRLVDRYSGTVMGSWVDGLAAFWPGVQVLAGDVKGAVRSHLAYYKLWNTWGGIPERWLPTNQSNASILLEWYLLRPEFLESNYYLYQATKDPLYFQTAKVALRDIDAANKVKCGFAAVQDVRTGQLSDRMDTFFLSETLKYLYLTFVPNHPLNRKLQNMVFSTEAHPLWSDPSIVRSSSADNYPGLGPLTAPNTSPKPSGILTWLFSILTPPALDGAEFAADPDELWQTHCEVWPQSSGSLIAAAEVFYILDSAIDYKKPDWLHRTQDIEEIDDFLRIYAYDATCPAR